MAEKKCQTRTGTQALQWVLLLSCDHSMSLPDYTWAGAEDAMLLVHSPLLFCLVLLEFLYPWALSKMQIFFLALSIKSGFQNRPSRTGDRCGLHSEEWWVEGSGKSSRQAAN